MHVRVETYELELTTPIITAHGPIATRRIIVVHTSDGAAQGSGEASPLPGFGLESYDDALRQLRGWSLDRVIPTGPAAAAAVASALDNLEAARAGVGLDEWLSGRTTDGRLAVQALIGASTPHDVAEAAGHAARSGHLAVKLKVAAQPPEVDIARARAARAAVGPNMLLRLDANQGWDLATAESVLRSLHDVDVDFVEEPTPRIDDFALLATRTGISVAVDEHLADHETAAAILRRSAAAVAILKPAVLGGPTATFALAVAAQKQGLRCVVSSFIDGPAGLRCARDLALAVDSTAVHGVGTAELFGSQLPLDITPLGGSLYRDATAITLPPGLELARVTPELDQTTVPAGLLSAHEVAAKVWCVLRVIEGVVTFVFEEETQRPRQVTAGEHQVIPPQRLHHLEIRSHAKFVVEFHRPPT